jgi:lysozyme family protein
MAEFKQAFQLMIAHEGGYVNDPDDPGGETYKGVARKMHSGWLGWHIVDLLKRQPGFPANLDTNAELQKEVESFYEVQFWSRIAGSMIQEQAVANSIFDFAVNAGVSTSASLAQAVVEVIPDGVIGNKTITAINSVMPELFLAKFTVAKIARYVHIVKKRPISRKYFYGWVLRALEEN